MMHADVFGWESYCAGSNQPEGNGSFDTSGVVMANLALNRSARTCVIPAFSFSFRLSVLRISPLMDLAVWGRACLMSCIGVSWFGRFRHTEDYADGRQQRGI